MIRAKKSARRAADAAAPPVASVGNTRYRRRRWAVAAGLAVSLTAAALTFVQPIAQAQAQPKKYTDGQYVVMLDSAAVTALAQANGIDVSRRTTGPITTLTAQLTAAQATALDADPRVVGISPNVTFVADADMVAPAIQRVGADLPPVSAGTSTATPQGAIAVIDTGVDSHPDYTLAGGIDCLDGTSSFADGNGHGTGVAGVAAARTNGVGLVGSAPGAPVYAVRVLDAKLKGSLSNLVCGLNWVAANAQALNIKVANLSLGTTGSDSQNCGQDISDVLHQAICAVVAAGVVPVAAAGNNGRDISGQVPAAYDEVLTATNVVDFDGRPGGLATTKPCTSGNADDTGASASNYATQVADFAHVVAAPGECPYTTKKGGRYGYIQSGTSMSAGVTSGVVLDCMQPGQPCAGKNPAGVISTIISIAHAASATRGFTGDPNSTVDGKYRGYLISADFAGVTVPPTTTTTAPPTTTEPTVPPTTTEPTVPPTTTEPTVPPTTTEPTVPPTTPTTTEPTVPPTTPTTPTTVTPTTTTVPPPAPDTTAPTVQIVAPAPGAVVSGTVVLRATASDNVGVTTVRFSVGTTILGNATKAADGSWELVYNTASVRNGTYSVVAKASDAANNIGTSAPVTITVRN